VINANDPFVCKKVRGDNSRSRFLIIFTRLSGVHLFSAANKLAVLCLGCGVLSCGGGPSGSSSGSQSVSWQTVNVPIGATKVAFFAVNSSNHWFLADQNKGFYRSTDGGATWTPINTGISTNLAWSINVNPGNGDLIASTYSGSSTNANPVNFYRSSNEGGSWTLIPSVHLSSATAPTGCAFPGNQVIVCGGFWAPSPSSGAWVSTDGGQTTTNVSNSTATRGAVYSLAVNPINGDLWLGTEQMGIFRSTDSGFTWTQASPPDQNIDPANGIRDGNIYGITFDSSGNVLFSSQGGIWKSSAKGAGFSWTNVLANTNTAQGHGMARNASGRLFYGHNADPSKNPTSVQCSADDGSTWTACDSGLPSGLTGREFVVNPSDGKLYGVMLAEGAGTGALYRTVSPVQ
jgi:photosystem II stability/assembly factor-like uncharacterized protein